MTPASSPSEAATTWLSYHDFGGGTAASASSAASPSPPPSTNRSGSTVVARLSIASAQRFGPVVAARACATASPASRRASRSAAVVPAGKARLGDVPAERGAGAHRLDAAALAADAGRPVRIDQRCGRAGPPVALPRSNAAVLEDGAADAGADGQHARRWPCPSAAPNARLGDQRHACSRCRSSPARPKRCSIRVRQRRRRQVDVAARKHPPPAVDAARARRCRSRRRVGGVRARRSALRSGASTASGIGRTRRPACLQDRRHPSPTSAARRCVPPMSMPIAVLRHRRRQATLTIGRAVAGDHRLDLAQARHGDGLQPLPGHRAVERDAVLPQRAPGDDARCAVAHRDLHLAEEGLVIDAGRQHRPRHVAGHLRHRRAGFRRTGIGQLQHLRAALEAESACRPGSARRSWPRRPPGSRLPAR